jgi:hypothetical protein
MLQAGFRLRITAGMTICESIKFDTSIIIGIFAESVNLVDRRKLIIYSCLWLIQKSGFSEKSFCRTLPAKRCGLL